MQAKGWGRKRKIPRFDLNMFRRTRQHWWNTAGNEYVVRGTRQAMQSEIRSRSSSSFD